jgi:hypothetical protein
MPKYIIYSDVCGRTVVDGYWRLSEWCINHGRWRCSYVCESVHIEDENGLPVDVPRKQDNDRTYKIVRR